jgi:hypothetical protein
LSAKQTDSDLIEKKIDKYQAGECDARRDETGHKVRMPFDELVTEVSGISSIEIRK